MIGIDTNVLVRFLVDDDVGQSEVARKFMAERSSESPAFLSAVALAETVWLLSKRFEYPKAIIIETIKALLSADGLLIEYTDDLDFWLNGDVEPRGDLSDHLIAWAGVRAGCRSTVTFDIKAAKAVPRMELLQ